MDLIVKSELIKDMWNIIGIEPYSHDKEPKLLDDVFIYSNLTEDQLIEVYVNSKVQKGLDQK